VILHENIQPCDIIEAYVRSVFVGVVLSQNAKQNQKGEEDNSNESTVRLSLSSVATSEDVMVRFINKRLKWYYV
jgi:GTP-sensing pleiotropic transcriptional regulator CodY